MSAAGREGPRGLDAVTIWLITVIVMVFAMVVLGGVTRLTQSGLSMVDWHPIMGVIPPMSTAEWEDAFAAYRRYPEYQAINYGMTLAEFQSIYLMEYTHRMWGRLIGLVYFAPFLWFVIRGRVRGRLAVKLGAVLALGAAQGLMGWVMVQSGLVDNPSVSPYRLTAHLALAVTIYLWLLWIVLDRTLAPQSDRDPKALRGATRGVLALALLTMASGGFVAGLDAGMTYNTFPKMDGQWVPDGIWMLSPGWRNPFENIAMVQFDHRVLAVTLVIAVLALAGFGLRRVAAPRARAALVLAGAMAVIQGGLGITTLLMATPAPVAAMHQTGALVLVGLLTWAAFERRAAGAGTP